MKRFLLGLALFLCSFGAYAHSPGSPYNNSGSPTSPSIGNGGGGGGTPGGSNGQIQYNNSGAFGGTSTPSANTAAQFNNSTLLATTAFVNRVGYQFSSIQTYNANVALDATAFGGLIVPVQGAITITLPPLASCPTGPAGVIFIYNVSSASTVQAASGEHILFDPAGSPISGLSIGQSDSLAVVCLTFSPGPVWVTGPVSSLSLTQSAIWANPVFPNAPKVSAFGTAGILANDSTGLFSSVTDVPRTDTQNVFTNLQFVTNAAGIGALSGTDPSNASVGLMGYTSFLGGPLLASSNTGTGTPHPWHLCSYTGLFSGLDAAHCVVQGESAGSLTVPGVTTLGATAQATGASGELAMAKISASGTAPGAGFGKMEWVAGTTAGTCKLIAYAGTSTTPTTIIDNVGGGC